MLWMREYGALYSIRTLGPVARSTREGVVRNVASRDRQRTVPHVAAAALAAALACSLGLAAPQARAQSPRPNAQYQPREAPYQPRPAVAAWPSPLLAIVSIASQRVTIYDKNGVVTSSPVSTGQRGFETPEGVFSIIERKEEHFSNIYDEAAMPFMQRITWSGVALHAGSLPGYPASHGCIRLPFGFAENLFRMTRINTRVVVVPTDTEPMAMAHPVLFQPQVARFQSLPPKPVEGPEQSRPAPVFRPIDAGAAIETPMMLGGRLPKPALAELSEPPVQPQKAVINSLEAARAQRVAAARKAASTQPSPPTRPSCCSASSSPRPPKRSERSAAPTSTSAAPRAVPSPPSVRSPSPRPRSAPRSPRPPTPSSSRKRPPPRQLRQRRGLPRSRPRMRRKRPPRPRRKLRRPAPPLWPSPAPPIG